MHRQHRILIIQDTNDPLPILDLYRYLLSTKKNYIVYTCNNDISEVCLEIIKRDPDTVFFSTDFFDDTETLKCFLQKVHEIDEDLFLINMHYYNDYDIMDTIDNVVFVYSIDIIGCAFYPNAVIEKIGSMLSFGSNDFEDSIKDYVYDLIKGFDCQRFRNGSDYVSQSIMFILKNDKKYLTFNKDVYPYLIKKYDASLESIDNAMRRFANAAWEKISDKLKEKYFHEYLVNNIKPTSQEFVFELADRIYIDHRKDFCLYYIENSH